MEAQMEREYVKGGEFLITEPTAAEVFTPEDFTEEQLMMREPKAETWG